ncbi:MULTISPECIES: GNAT family N-acetyltransferase [unclassified Amycolatopsis]|uniref:GNAT family N-acetyltransferase n=1 Tax=unclassified Amycolatopsis TaxID=2618356 RepID=UPI00287717E8|nr:MULTISPECIES: GNAT family N-acetyltransferase [unclassified Amycolatopsis]MDS0134055.1 GNAT family N-acetyltransferase [Amycolatopsis sp. 505]MDS0144931.1 GNAT family N-acetyltransferase [Amycolatopsis sp. CM201R]
MIRLAHTADLPPAARTLVHDVFENDFTDADWENSLGGTHALAYEGTDLVGHASLVQRRLLHGGRVLRAGYVEAVAVRADHRRRGHASALMAALERLLPGYDLGALSAAEKAVPLYEGRGWQQWRGPTSALTPDGIQRTEDEDGGVYVFPGRVPLDLDVELTADWRAGDVW